jgi:glutamyl-tRNA reductase
VLLIGAGTIAELAAKQLVRHGVGELLVVGRDVERAGRLAERHGGRVVTLDRLGEALTRSDVVISSTAAPRPIVCRDQLERALARGGRASSRPLLVIDLAVPRDVDPAVAGLPGVELSTSDDLRQVVEQRLAQRSAELPAAYSEVRAEVARFTRWLSVREARLQLTTVGLEKPETGSLAFAVG